MAADHVKILQNMIDCAADYSFGPKAVAALSSAIAALRAEAGAVGLEVWRDAVLDGNAVYALMDSRAKRFVSSEAVSEVLDAVARVARSATPDNRPRPSQKDSQP